MRICVMQGDVAAQSCKSIRGRCNDAAMKDYRQDNTHTLLMNDAVNEVDS